MAQINIDRTTNKAVNQPSPLTYAIEVPEDFTLSKIIEVQEGEIQKSNEQGQLLYKINVATNPDGTEIFDETTADKTVTKTEEKEIKTTYTDENGKEITKIIIVENPTEWVYNNPIMIPNMTEKVITFENSPFEFTVQEILIAKFRNILEISSCDNLCADMFLNEDDMDLTDIKANTGVALMQLLPNGQAKTKELTLKTATKSFTLLEFIADSEVDIYINDIKFVSNFAVLTEATTKCTIKFVNTTDKLKLVKSYAIGY